MGSILNFFTKENGEFRWKLACSLIYGASFFYIGLIISCLGPLIPFLARKLQMQESDFTSSFASRGIGYLLGTFISGKIQEGNEKIHQLFFIFEILLSATCYLTQITDNYNFILIIFFFQSVLCGLIDVQGNVLIIQVHGSKVEPWMQGIHFAFGFGGIISPIFVGFVQYETFYYIALFGFLLSFTNLIIDSPSLVNQLIEKSTEHFQEMSPSLITKLKIFFFLYVGLEVGFGSWISSYAILENALNMQNAAFAASIFWATFTFGRLIAIPISHYYDGKKVIEINLLFTIIVTSVSLVILLIFDQEYKAHVIFIGGGFLGFFTSSIYPQAMCLPKNLEKWMTQAQTSGVIVFGCIGDIFLTFVMGISLDIFGPISLFWICCGCSIVLYILLQRIIAEGEPDKPASKVLELLHPIKH